MLDGAVGAEMLWAVAGSGTSQLARQPIKAVADHTEERGLVIDRLKRKVGVARSGNIADLDGPPRPGR
jgi:hypothetical protein